MARMSRRELMLGLGTGGAPLAALSALAVCGEGGQREWGNGRLLAWGRTEGLYQSDADGSVRVLMIDRPWTIAELPTSLHKGARVEIAVEDVGGYKAGTLLTRDGVTLACTLGRRLYE